MREIKFRAWNIYTKKWVMLHGIESMGSYELFNGTLALDSTGDWKWQQFTGLKDKNGTEIYEGDILKQQFTSRTNATAKLVRGEKLYDFIGAVEWDNEITGFFLSGKDPRGVLRTRFSRIINDEPCEVIGNIYENPELINGKT